MPGQCRSAQAGSGPLQAGQDGDRRSGVTDAAASTYATGPSPPATPQCTPGPRDALREPDFDPIRDRADFKKLMGELAIRSTSPLVGK
jgi:hypothetical protein